MRMSRPRGVTLIELMIGLFIMAMLLMAAMPFGAHWVSSNRQMEARSVLWEGVSQARAMALRNPSARRATAPAAMLRLRAGWLEVMVAGVDTPAWSAKLRDGVHLKLADQDGFANADALTASASLRAVCACLVPMAAPIATSHWAASPSASPTRIRCMSTCSEPRSPRRQRGDMLLEALVAVLITSLIAAGLAHVQSRLMANQRATKIERLVVSQLREQLQNAGTGLCGSSTISLALAADLSRDAQVACGTAPQINVGLGSTVLSVEAPREVGLSVRAADLELDGDDPGEYGADLLLSSHQ